MFSKIRSIFPTSVRCITKSSGKNANPYEKTTDKSPSHEVLASIVRDYLPGQWQNVTSESLIIKKMRGGMSNTVFQVTLPDNYQKALIDEPKTVLVRFYQPLSVDSVSERLSESLAFMFLAERQLGPKLLAFFPNGRIEEFIDARSLTAEELNDKNISLAIAEKMALIHTVSAPLSRKRDLLFDLMEKWLLKIEADSTSWEIKDIHIQKCVDYFSEHSLFAEVCWLREFLSKVKSPIVFCHNDLQEGNILITLPTVGSKTPNIIFIDYEYCFYNYRGFDLANHFLEYTMKYTTDKYPNFTVDMNDYPSEEHQLLFIKRYLRANKYLNHKIDEGNSGDAQFNSILKFSQDDDVNSSGQISDEELQVLNEVSKFRLASHLMWGIWAATRGFQSNANFGYWEYCVARLEAYYQTKEEIMSGSDT